MANALFDHARENFLGQTSASIDWDTDTIKVTLVKTAYTVNLATHDFFDDLGANAFGNSGSGTRANQPTIASPTVTAGTADCADTVVTTPTAALVASYIVPFKSITSDAASPIICYIDTATGLPITCNGADVTIVWAAGGVFTL